MIEQTGSVSAATATTTTTTAHERHRPSPPASDGLVEHGPEAQAGVPSPPWYRRHARDLAGMVLLLATLAFLWGRARHVWYWIDEGISIGIASQPLARIPELLAQDGAPPLYYVLLHLWIGLFGTSEAATHVLSLVFALATVPAALWAGWSLFGRRTGWVCAALAALSPYLAYYANETRMYSMVVLISVLACATFLHAFVFGRRRYLPAFALALTLGLYSHNWALFLGLAFGATMLALAVLADDRRRVLTDGVLAFGAVALAYVPWVPTLLYQMEHSGAPFVQSPTLLLARDDLVSLIGSPEAAAVLALGVALGLAVLVPWPWPRPAPPAATAAVTTAATVGIVVAVGWLVSRQDAVWVFRYLAVIVGPLLLLLGAGLARGGRTATAALAVYAVLTLPVGVKNVPDVKSNVREVAEEAAPLLQPGDLVITSFGRVPVLAHYLPQGLRYAETMGLIAEGAVSDQRDPIERLEELLPEETLPPLLDALAEGGHALVVCPPPEILLEDFTEFLTLISDRCEDALALVAEDERFRLDLEVEPRTEVSQAPEDGYLFTKVAP